jgi:ABC-type Fe3+/spermidine/putrescine transport system ATPase subunit
MESLINIRRLTKAFGDFIAVDSIDLSIREGEFLTLLGSSGSGKTTTLRLIAGLDPPTSGNIVYRGKDISALPTRLRDMRLVFQDYALFPHLNVFDNIAFGLRVRVTRHKYDEGRVNELVSKYLEFVHLGGQDQKMPHQLSGGQKQRVALARALVSDPPVVLFDEPLGSLDASLRKAMQFELKRMHRELRKTFIYVTHDQEEAMAMSDRIVVMKDAKILQVDTPEALYYEPTSTAVARFVGAANVVTGRVVRSDASETVVAVADGQLAAPGRAAAWKAGEEVAIVLRAESIGLTSAQDVAVRNAISGVVVGRLFLGKAIEYQVELADRHNTLTVTSSREDSVYEVGSRVAVVPKRNAVRILSA